MTASVALPVYNYPKVRPDNCLEFDPNGPVPNEIPYFRKHPEYPWIFIPLWQNCKYRTTRQAKLNNCQDCHRTREVWYCSLLKEDTFPITCHSCTKREE